jgi:hypothetical protein
MNKKKAAPISEWEGVEGDAGGVHTQVGGSPQTAIEMIAPSMIRTHNTPVESPCDGTGLGEGY